MITAIVVILVIQLVVFTILLAVIYSSVEQRLCNIAQALNDSQTRLGLILDAIGRY